MIFFSSAVMSDQWDYRPGTLVPGTKYQIVSKLGAGGMGTVYEVEDVSVEKRFVLKTIHVRYAGHNVAVERFVREAKALGKLEHKNIVQVVTAGVTEDALQLRYFVMEKLSGHSLRTVLHSKGALALDAACHFMIELLSALNCAHDAGIIHRDIKPENIFVSKDSMGTTTLKLLDFGIMSSTGTRTSDRKGFMGTARYAAPEMQTPGYEATPLADLYSASLVFYEMVCGSGPYDDLEEVPDLLEAHRLKPPPKPALFRPGIPESLQALILRGLAKDPNARPVDAFSYAEEVNAIRRELRSGTPSVTSKVAPPSEATIEKIIQSARTREGAITPAPQAVMPPSERYGLPPQLNPSDIDRQAAALFASASGPASRPKVAKESETMGATHSTAPDLRTPRSRTWVWALAAAFVLMIAVVILSTRKATPTTTATAPAAVPSPSPTPSPTPTPTPTPSATPTPSPVPTSSSTPTHHRGHPPPPAPTNALPGSGL